MDKKKWYQTNIGIVIVILLFFPVGFYLMWKHGTWKTSTYLKIVGAFFLFAIINSLIYNLGPRAKKDRAEIERIKNLQNANTATSTQSAPSATNQLADKPKTPEETLEAICQKYGGTDNCVYTKDASGKWAIAQIMQYESDAFMFTGAKQNSRDFIFAVYATKLPISHVAISNNYYAGGKYYRAGLGANVASTQPDSTWSNKSVGPSIFYDFLEGHTNGTSGDGQNSTYVETNLN